MRSRWLSPLLLVALLATSQVAGAQDFDPTGRRPRPPAGDGGRPRPRHDDDGGGKKPDVDKLIARYTAILMSKPHEAFPLQKLSELYRERDGKLDALVAEFEKRAAADGPDQLNAKLALAAIYEMAQRREDARKLLEEAVQAKPKLEAPRLMLARLAEKAGDSAGAQGHYEAALPLMSKGIEKERVIRTLMVLSVELKDYDKARSYHGELVKAAGGSLFVKRELGVELLNRANYALAEEEFRKLVQAAAGDNRALAPALRDLGKALAKQKKMDEALKVLERARSIAGQDAGIRNEILFLLTDVFREQGKLVELIAILEAEPGRDFQRLAVIGGLYEETGQVDKALDTYREALKVDARDIDVRVRLVHLLQTAGLLDEAIDAYQALIKAAPHNADFVFELAETFIQRGDRDKALKLVSELERRSGQEGDILAAVADFYERIEEQGLAIKVLERMAKLPSGDHQYLIDLGDRYYQQEDKKKAEATWARIRTLVPNRALAASILGEVYLEHDMPNEALAELREAVKLAPGQKRYEKQLAVALERTATGAHTSRSNYLEALQIWERLAKEAADDALLAREARSHVVSLWSILRILPDQVAPLSAKLAANPPDLEAGRLLAEVLRRLSRLPEAEKTLRRVVELAPGDESSLLALERILVMRRDLPGAIEVLKKLVEVNPKRAREHYQRMAQYASELYRDDEAIEYAARAVELSPEDALGHYKLGKMYQKRQDTERAMGELRKAISKNDRLFPAYFDLAEMLLSAGKVDDADKLYRQVVRAARDEEFVVRAARSSMQINLGKGTLESLERELLPVALGNPQKSVYRRLLVEVYGAMTFPLVHAAHLGRGEAASAARQALSTIGARAVKPLLDALADPKDAQQRIAIEVLAYVQNKGAGPALFNFALGQADRELRVRAMVACGALEDPELLSRYEQVLAPAAGDGAAVGDAIAVAAAWGVARMGSKQAEPLLRRLLDSGSPDIRALAALGLGLSGDGKHAEALAALARSPEAGPTTRAAAAHALGELGQASQRPMLLALTDSSEVAVKTAAMLALARMRPVDDTAVSADAGAILARALLGDDPELRRAAMAAATALVTGEYRRTRAALPVPDGGIAIADVLRGLGPSGYSREEQARALGSLRDSLTQAALAAVATSPERARVVAELTLTDLEPLIEGPSAGPFPEAAKAELERTAAAIAEASVTGFVALTRHPSVEMRKRAIEFLATRPEPEAKRAVVAAMSEADPEVCKTALGAVRGEVDPTAVAALVKLLGASESWSLRARAAEALGRLDASADAGAQRERLKALEKAATGDAFALVREAALVGLAQSGGSGAAPILARVASRDQEPRLRRLAKELGKKRATP